MTSEASAKGAVEVLAGKHLLVVLGSYRSKRHIYERAMDLGVRLVVLDGPGHWMRECVGPSSLVERHLVVDLAPLSTFVDRAVEAVHAAGVSFDGIGTIDEFPLAGPKNTPWLGKIARITGVPATLLWPLVAAEIIRRNPVTIASSSKRWPRSTESVTAVMIFTRRPGVIPTRARNQVSPSPLPWLYR